jgi:hypothetical protein
VATTVLALAIYANFFTHHWIVDLRLPIALLLLIVLRKTWVFYRVGVRRYRMPLALSFALIGFFLWIAENTGTFLDAWNYPDQVDVWRLVHPAKFGAWALLVSMSFVLVASVKALEGKLYHRGTPAAVATLRATEVGPQVDGRWGTRWRSKRRRQHTSNSAPWWRHRAVGPRNCRCDPPLSVR